MTDFMEEKTDAAMRDWAWATWPFKCRVNSAETLHFPAYVKPGTGEAGAGNWTAIVRSESQ